jgi:hypothetical protein
MGAELFHTDGQIDMTKLVVAYRNFANAPKKYVEGLVGNLGEIRPLGYAWAIKLCARNIVLAFWLFTLLVVKDIWWSSLVSVTKLCV